MDAQPSVLPYLRDPEVERMDHGDAGALGRLRGADGGAHGGKRRSDGGLGERAGRPDSAGGGVAGRTRRPRGRMQPTAAPTVAAAAPRPRRRRRDGDCHGRGRGGTVSPDFRVREGICTAPPAHEALAARLSADIQARAARPGRAPRGDRVRHGDQGLLLHRQRPSLRLGERRQGDHPGRAAALAPGDGAAAVVVGEGAGAADDHPVRQRRGDRPVGRGGHEPAAALPQPGEDGRRPSSARTATGGSPRSPRTTRCCCSNCSPRPTRC